MQGTLLLAVVFLALSTFAQTGPGGVGNSTTNALWLKADDITGLSAGDPLSVSWPDASGNSNDASQSTAGYRPTYQSSAGISSVRFDGVDDYLDDARTYNARTVFAVYAPSTTLQATTDLGQIWGNYDEGIHIAADARSGGNAQGFSFDGFTSSGTTAKYGLNGAAYGSFNGNTNASPYVYDQRQFISAEFNTSKPLTRQIIGSLVPSFAVGAHQFGGDISEIIVYNTVLNTAQRNIVDNYLAAKYGITMAANNLYSYHSTHANDLVGIGRADASNTHNVAVSAGLIQITAGAGLDADGEYLLFAHNGGSIASWTSTEVPGNGYERIAREWRFDETGDLGDITLTLDSTLLSARSAGHTIFMLLVDSDGDFSSGATAYQLSEATGNTFEIDIDINDGDYITIAAFKPEVSFTTASMFGPEDKGQDTIMIELNTVLDDDVTVDYAVTGGTATGLGTDYTLADGTATIPAGETNAMIIFTIVDDGDLETTETIELTLSNPDGAVLGTQTTLTYSINDNDATRDIEFTVRSATGDESVSAVVVAIHLDVVDPINPTSVDYTVTGDDAIGGGVDYTVANGTATIAAGDTHTTFTITIIDDLLDEEDEKIVFTLSNPVNANVGGNNTYTYKINDNDAAPTVSFTASSSSGSEETSPLVLTAQLSAVSGKDVTVNYGAGAGTATLGSDFTLPGSSIFIPAGSSSATINVNIIDDNTEEPAETIIINLTGATNATVTNPSTYTYTILESDGIGTGGPGGVGDMTTNKLWLKADAITGLSNGDAIAGNWPDASGNAHHASQSVAGYRPIYSAASANGKPAVTFDGVDDHLDDNRTYSASSVFVVFRVNSATQNTNHLAQLWGSYGEGVQVSVDPRPSNTRGYSFDGGNITSNTGRYALNSNTMTAGYYSDNNSVQWSYNQWNLLTVEFNSQQSITRQVIAALLPSLPVGSHHLGGEIAEIIVYSDTLGVTRRSIIQNYLAAKYSLTIANDLYSFESTHGEGLIGIGSADGTLNHLYSESGEAIAIGLPSSLGSGDYLFIGHNGGDIDSFSTVGLPAVPGISRVAREWRVDETGDVGTITFTVDTVDLPAKPSGENNYLLFVDNDGDYSNGATIYRLSYSGGKYVASDIDLNDGDYLTIVTAANVSTATGDFNTAGNWATGSVPTTMQPAIISQGQTLTLSGNALVGSAFVSAGATLELGSYELEIDQGDFIVGGSVNAGTGNILYSAVGDQSVAGIVYYDLSIEGSGNKTLAGDIEIAGSLNISTGTLDANASGDFEITIEGNWKIDGGSFEARNGMVIFAGGANQNITALNSAFYNIEIDNGSGITIMDVVEVSNTLHLTDGVITTNANRLYVSNTSNAAIAGASATSFINGNLRRAITSNTSVYRFPVGDGTAAANYHFADLRNNNLTGVSYLDASFIPLANHDDADINLAPNGFIVNTVNTAGVWLIEPDQQPSGGNYGMVLSIDNFVGLADNEFLIVKRPSNSTTAAEWSTGGGVYTPDNGYGRLLSHGEALVNGLTSFSQFGVGGGSGGALPIELLHFDAHLTDEGTVMIDWATAIEINNDYFTIERSSDGKTFEGIQEIKGAGNSTVTKNYQTEDLSPLTGISYYRLKQTDTDGKFEHSESAAIRNIPAETANFNLYPNPVSGSSLTIDLGPQQFSLNDGSDLANIQIINMLGEVVLTQSIAGSGKTGITLPNSLAKGMYMMQIQHQGNVQNQPFLYR